MAGQSKSTANENNTYEISKSFNVSALKNITKRNVQYSKDKDGVVRFRDQNQRERAPAFSKYTKTEILGYLENPFSSQKNLCDASVYLYAANSRYKRLVKYYASLTDFTYYLTLNSDVDIGNGTDDKNDDIKSKYNSTMRMLERFDVKARMYPVLTSTFKQDTYYGTFVVDEKNKTITLQTLPFDYCAISTQTDGVFDVDFDFKYFDTYPNHLEYFPKEFKNKYNLYQKDRNSKRYQRLDVPNSFAIKVNDETPTYSTPPFSGVFPALYDLSDYEALHLTKTELDNYALLVMTLGTNKNGGWLLDFQKAKDFWQNLDDVLPEQVGSVLTPMDINKISFDESGKTDDSNIATSSKNVWSAAGINAHLFTESNSSAAIRLSIDNDQMITYMVVLQIQDVFNRLFRSISFADIFQINFLNSSRYNEKEVISHIKDACTLGAPLVSAYCALNSLSGSVESALYLENDVLKVKDKFKPLESSYNTSGSNEVGRPTAESKGEDVGDAGQNTIDHDSNEDKKV